MSLPITQTAFDDIVLGIADFQTDLAEKAFIMRVQGDPAAEERETEGIMLMNILDALRDYDVDSGFLTDEEIAYLHELATIIVEECPI